jgi:hypothetical protein
MRFSVLAARDRNLAIIAGASAGGVNFDPRTFAAKVANYVLVRVLVFQNQKKRKRLNLLWLFRENGFCRAHHI